MILAGWIALLMISDSQAASAQKFLKDWQSQQRVPDEHEWQEAYAYINRALMLDSTNPNYLEKKAELYRWKALFSGNTLQERDTANRIALDQYRHILQLKPSWPNYWVGLIKVKFALWEYDDEMDKALQNAAHYGPWFKHNQQTILKVGYQSWIYLDETTREVVNETLERAIKIQPHKTIQLAFDVGFNEQLMPYIEKDKSLKHIYNRELANRKKSL